MKLILFYFSICKCIAPENNRKITNQNLFIYHVSSVLSVLNSILIMFFEYVSIQFDFFRHVLTRYSYF